MAVEREEGDRVGLTKPSDRPATQMLSRKEVYSVSTTQSYAIFGGTLATAVTFALVSAPASADIVDQFRKTHSGKCLEVGGWILDGGATANQWICHGGANQKWNG